MYTCISIELAVGWLLSACLPLSNAEDYLAPLQLVWLSVAAASGGPPDGSPLPGHETGADLRFFRLVSFGNDYYYI